MQPSSVAIFGGLTTLVASFVWGAFYLGPPGERPTGQPVETQRPVLASPVVDGFGPLPGCADKRALVTIIGLLRNRVTAQQTALVNVQETARSSSGGRTERVCSADVVTSHGQTAVVYDILTLPPKDTWRISATVQGGLAWSPF